MLTLLALPSVSILPTKTGFYISFISKIFKPFISSPTSAYIFAPIYFVITFFAYPSVSILPTNDEFYGSVTSIIFRPAKPSAINA